MAVVAAASPRTIGPTSSRSHPGSTRMSLFRKTRTSGRVAAPTPWLQPALKPTLFSFSSCRTQPHFARTSSWLPSTEPLSTSTTSSRSFG